jgi:signal transduction histidine kinase
MGQLTNHLHRIACIAAMTVWLAWGWPLIKHFMLGLTIRDFPVSPTLFIPYAIFGAVVLCAMALRLRPAVQWTLLCVELAAVVAMVMILPWAGISQFLVISAWQAAILTTPRKALGWAVFQTGLVVGALAQDISPDLCWVIVKSFALQLLLLFLARALRREAETARELAQTNRELRSAQAIIANNVRDAERLRISRELHDAWGHELTALGLQLEIASHVADPARKNDHVMQAKGLASALLRKVRDVVSTLRDAERFVLRDALETLAQSVPTPVIHVEITADVRVSPEQAHTLMRCAQEAVTNAVRHAQAANLWLQVTADGEGVRLVARDDGQATPTAAGAGSGLRGMRERVESLGGRLAIRNAIGSGFTVEAWLPSGAPQPA